MVRDFSAADRKKKEARIKTRENPGNLSPEVLARLETTVKASLKDGYLPCPVAWKIAQEAGVPRISVGTLADSLGIRIADCQLGLFKADKVARREPLSTVDDPAILGQLEALSKTGELTCTRVFELAAQSRLAPRAIADAANLRRFKVRSCQLGCF